MRAAGSRADGDCQSSLKGGRSQSDIQDELTWKSLAQRQGYHGYVG